MVHGSDGSDKFAEGQLTPISQTMPRQTFPLDVSVTLRETIPGDEWAGGGGDLNKI